MVSDGLRGGHNAIKPPQHHQTRPSIHPVVRTGDPLRMVWLTESRFQNFTITRQSARKHSGKARRRIYSSIWRRMNMPSGSTPCFCFSGISGVGRKNGKVERNSWLCSKIKHGIAKLTKRYVCRLNAGNCNWSGTHLWIDTTGVAASTKSISQVANLERGPAKSSRSNAS